MPTSCTKWIGIIQRRWDQIVMCIKLIYSYFNLLFFSLLVFARKWKRLFHFSPKRIWPFELYTIVCGIFETRKLIQMEGFPEVSSAFLISLQLHLFLELRLKQCRTNSFYIRFQNDIVIFLKYVQGEHMSSLREHKVTYAPWIFPFEFDFCMQQ